MNTTNEFLDAVKAKTGAGSDYKLANILEVTRGGISSYRTGRTCLDDETCLKVASILEIDPAMVFAAIYAERSKNADAKAVWKSLFEKLGGVAASLLIATTLGGMTPTNANAGAASSVDVTSHNNVYYVKSTKRRARQTKRKIDLSFLVNNFLGIA